MGVGLCLRALEMALSSGRRPRIFNTDQGSQYASEEWQKTIRSEGIQISMDGKGRWADNIIMEGFWRTYKHEFFLHREPKTLQEAEDSARSRVYDREMAGILQPGKASFLAEEQKSITVQRRIGHPPSLRYKIAPKMD